MATGYWDARAEAEATATEPRWIWHRRQHRDVGRADNFLKGRWEERNWLNVPGPFYGAETDTCVAGIPAASGHVLCDEDGMEFVWRQPRDLDEVRAILDAAYQDPFDGYGWDGDEHWTPDLVLDWWDDRGRIEEWLAEANFNDLARLEHSPRGLRPDTANTSQKTCATTFSVTRNGWPLDAREFLAGQLDGEPEPGDAAEGAECERGEAERAPAPELGQEPAHRHAGADEDPDDPSVHGGNHRQPNPGAEGVSPSEADPERAQM